MRILILALGNDLMSDDGAGLKAGRLLEERGYRVVEIGTDIFRLHRYYDGEEKLIIIDAVLSDDYPPGEVIHLEGDEIFERLNARIRSAHFIGAIDALRLLMELDERLKNVELHFIGIVAKRIELGMELSEEVRKALPRVLEIVESVAS